MTPDKLLDFIAENVGDGSSRSKCVFGTIPAGGDMGSMEFKEIDVDAASEFWKSARIVPKKLGIRDGAPHLLVNGRVRYFPECYMTADFRSWSVL